MSRPQLASIGSVFDGQKFVTAAGGDRASGDDHVCLRIEHQARGLSTVLIRVVYASGPKLRAARRVFDHSDLAGIALLRLPCDIPIAGRVEHHMVRYIRLPRWTVIALHPDLLSIRAVFYGSKVVISQAEGAACHVSIARRVHFDVVRGI